MRASTMLCVALLCVSSTVVVQAQTGLQEFAAPRAGIPDAQEKSASRAAAQKAMVKAMQRGRLKAAKYELSKLMYFEAQARHRRRADLAKRLQTRIIEQRATIRRITNAM
ncbi:MAG: hypothetical protein ACKVP3_21170 [Hyphomicrobiaceae bacterium]